MHNTVELLENDIIYVQKVGDQTEESMADLYEQIIKIAKRFRAADKRVLVLLNAEQEGKTDVKGREMAATIGRDLDYDKSASFGSSEYLHSVRELMISATQLDQKVANFKTREEAMEWLLK